MLTSFIYVKPLKKNKKLNESLICSKLYFIFLFIYLEGEYGEQCGACAECDDLKGNTGITKGDVPPIWQWAPCVLLAPAIPCDICCCPDCNGAASLKFIEEKKKKKKIILKFVR